MIQITQDGEHIKCFISSEAKIDKKFFPLKFEARTLLTEELVWKADMDLNTWAGWKPARDLIFQVKTKDDILLKEYNYDYSKENVPIYEFWDYFCRLNKNTVGLVLGCGNGTWGEWVVPVHRDDLQCHLVEGSETVFKKLQTAYKYKSKFKLYNCLITTDGSDCKFYESTSENGLGTVNFEYALSIDDSLKPTYTVKPSKSISRFLDEIGHVDWIRMDLEGIDYDIIKAIPKERLNSLIMLQYENIGLSEEKRSEIDQIMMPLGFNKTIYGIDTVYVK